MGRSSGMRALSPEIHGAFDTGLVLALALAPAWFSPDTPRVATIACYAAMLGLWLLSQLTCYPFGSLCLVRYSLHGIVESSLAPLLVASPWLLGFADRTEARLVFVVAGVVLLLLGLTAWGRHDERECPPEPPIDRGARPPHQGP